ncbi:hypothetical protein SETIT_5G159500v2 [Setaria italica]|uniref:Uncharacterized protein n=1 Tax=Setaria italica TaxID=4555 RepID=A0A368R582_SETIT|nr:hypothetical protein SETIT_5G159500v2 [Setaria italica]
MHPRLAHTMEVCITNISSHLYAFCWCDNQDSRSSKESVHLKRDHLQPFFANFQLCLVTTVTNRLQSCYAPRCSGLLDAWWQLGEH